MTIDTESPRAETLRSILADRPACAQSFRAWVKEEMGEDGIRLIERVEQERLYFFGEYLETAYQVKVTKEGLICIDVLTGRVRAIVEDRNLLLYHHTATGALPGIQTEGLLPGGKRGVPVANAYQNSGAGVYLTSKKSGPAAETYQRAAVQTHGGEGVAIGVVVQTGRLRPDPDDEDLRVGRRQFVTSAIRPGRLRIQT
jgi:hypothetical protein